MGRSLKGRRNTEVHEHYRKLIREMVGQPLVPGIPAGRGPKVDVTKIAKFSGSKVDVDIFDEWLQNLLRYFRATNAGSEKYEQFRVTATGIYLEGLALGWFNEEVEGVNRFQRQWTFEEVILGLYDRFIHTTASKTAAEKFDRVRFDKSRGVLELYNDMVQASNRMDEPPDSLTFWREFMGRLPESIRGEVQNKYHPMSASTRKILSKALRAEQTAKQGQWDRGSGSREEVPSEESSQSETEMIPMAPLRIPVSKSQFRDLQPQTGMSSTVDSQYHGRAKDYAPSSSSESTDSSS